MGGAANVALFKVHKLHLLALLKFTVRLVCLIPIQRWKFLYCRCLIKVKMKKNTALKYFAKSKHGPRNRARSMFPKLLNYSFSLTAVKSSLESLLLWLPFASRVLQLKLYKFTSMPLLITVHLLHSAVMLLLLYPPSFPLLRSLELF